MATALACLVLSACGSEAGPGTSPGTSGADPSSEAKASDATYFVTSDTDQVNKAAAAINAAGVKAVDVKRLSACNKITAYPAWRRCWHALLDPLSAALTDLAGVFTSFAARSFPAECLTEMESAAQSLTGLADKVDALLAGFDSDARKAQVAATKSYQKTVDSVAKDYTSPFQGVTGACYSPEELASINASPTPDAP